MVLKNEIIGILLVLICSSCGIKRNPQQISPTNPKPHGYISLAGFERDSTSYLKKQFVEQKANYIGKKMSFMLRDLQIPIESYIQIMYTMDTINGVYIAFQNKEEYNKKSDEGKKPLTMYIKFMDVLPAKESYNLSRKNKLKWTIDEFNYYGKQIVKDIDIVK